MRGLWRRRRGQEELDEEIRGHLDLARADRMERGETAEEADQGARREFGNVLLVKELTRDVWGGASLERFAQDVRFGLRLLGKRPGPSLLAVLTLALGIGASTSIFRLVVGQGMSMTLIGVALGTLGALAFSRVLASQLYGVRSADPMAFGLAAGLVSGVALLACYVPARRAARMDPLAALRTD